MVNTLHFGSTHLSKCIKFEFQLFEMFERLSWFLVAHLSSSVLDYTTDRTESHRKSELQLGLSDYPPQPCE